MSASNPENNPSQVVAPRVDFEAFRKASNERSRAILQQKKEELKQLKDKSRTAQEKFINSIDHNDPAYPHLVNFFGGNLDDPQFDDKSPECITAMMQLIDNIGEYHASRRYLEEFVSTQSDVAYLKDDIKDLKQGIKHNS